MKFRAGLCKRMCIATSYYSKPDHRKIWQYKLCMIVTDLLHVEMQVQQSRTLQISHRGHVKDLWPLLPLAAHSCYFKPLTQGQLPFHRYYSTSLAFADTLIPVKPVAWRYDTGEMVICGKRSALACQRGPDQRTLVQGL